MNIVKKLELYVPWINDKQFFISLQQYLEKIILAQKKMNLTGSLDLDDIFEHTQESLAFFSLMNIQTYQPSLALFDIGSGGGFPAIPIALAQPQWTVVMTDSIRKKTSFLEWIKQSFHMNNAEVYHGRVEQFYKDFPHRKFDFVTARGVGKTDYLTSLASHLLKPSGYLILWKSASEVEDELKKGEYVQENNLMMPSGKELISLKWISRSL